MLWTTETQRGGGTRAIQGDSNIRKQEHKNLEKSLKEELEEMWSVKATLVAPADTRNNLRSEISVQKREYWEESRSYTEPSGSQDPEL